ncbi:MAG: hypothetical protein ABW186_10245 [Rhodanobacteraceae bacterium]
MLTATCTSVLFLATAATGAVVADSYWTEFAAHPSDGIDGDFYGTAAALSSGTAVIGAFGDGGHTGAAYVLHKSGNAWEETQKLVADDGRPGEEFGYDAALTHDLIAVTAWYATIGTNTGQGAAYLYQSQGGTWTQSQKIVADDGSVFDNFGQSIAIDGTRIVIGANGATIGDQGAQGAAYIFDRDGSEWVQQQKIWSDDGDTVDNFGNAVAMRGSTLFVGALQAMADGHVNQGAVYVFTDDGSGTWSQVQKLTSSDGGAGDAFGASLSFDGTTLVVGATYAGGQGAAYVFESSGGTWTEVQKLVADDAAANDYFGNAVSLSGDSILVAADGKTVDGFTSRGAAYLFSRVGDTWVQSHRFVASDGETDNFYGASAALDGNIAVLTSAQRNTAYFYTRDSLLIDGFDG